MRRLTVLLIVLLAAACVWSFVVAREHGWWFPRNVSAFGERIDHLFELITWIAGAVLVIVFLLLALVVWRGARAGRAERAHGDTRLEVAWTVLPAGVLVFLAYDQLDEWRELKYAGSRPNVPVTARVVASQFDWHFVYPGRDGRFDTLDDLETAYELSVPEDEPVVLELVSRDVIHSFFVPALRVKQDVVPGMRPVIWFEARESGAYEIVCAELCGWGHYKMAGELAVLPRARFDARLVELEREFASNGEAAR
ncbi:MAG: cytochrome c oxidase subunit II [Planctomycetes bacterium]|nr:cytochrome c oxidase subunit II [Planctomycetota bacterium]